MKPFIEHNFKIYSPDSDGAHIEVGPDKDGLDIIEVRTTDKTSQEWFGKFGFGMTVEMARALGEVLIKLADELEK